MNPTLTRYVEHYGARLEVYPDDLRTRIHAVLTVRQKRRLTTAHGPTAKDAIENLTEKVLENEAND